MADTTFLVENICSTDYWDESGKCHISLYNGGETALSKMCNTYLKIDGCSDSAMLNMSQNDYAFSMSMTAIFIFAIFSYTLLTSISNITRKN